MLVSYLDRRAQNIIGTFSLFDLTATGYWPGYQTVVDCDRNRIQLFGNLGDTRHAELAAVPS
jgi:hypothetical protein